MKEFNFNRYSLRDIETCKLQYLCYLFEGYLLENPVKGMIEETEVWKKQHQDAILTCLLNGDTGMGMLHVWYVDGITKNLAEMRENLANKKETLRRIKKEIEKRLEAIECCV